jgi:hypothetical protein
MSVSDFNIVSINQLFSQANPSVTKFFTIGGDQDPHDDAFLLIQMSGVRKQGHRIEINDTELPGSDLPVAPHESEAEFTWLEHVPAGVLKAGENKLSIAKGADDNFRIRNVVVNWRE